MKSIRSKIMLSGAALILTVSLAIGISVSIITYRVSISDMEEMVSSNAVAFSSSVESRMDVFRREIEAVGNLDSITDEEIPLNERLQILAEQAKWTGFKDFSISDSNGYTYNDTQIADRDYFREANAGRTYVSSPVLRRTDNLITIMAGAPITNGNYEGVIYGGIDYDVFSDLISDIVLGKDGYAFIVDKDGVIIAHPNAELVENFTNYPKIAEQESEFRDIADVITKMANGETGAEYYDYMGESKYIAYIPLDGPEGWSLGITIGRHEVLGGFYSTLGIVIGLTIASMLVGLVIMSIIAKKISVPIKTVTGQIGNLAAGDLSTDIDIISSKDETGVLSGALKRTVDQLNLYIGDITSVLERISDNDITVDTDIDYEGDFAPIKDSLETIVRSLNATFRDIYEVANQVSDGSAQLSFAAQNLSQSSTEQAATIEELAASINNISEQINSNANSAQEAASRSKEAQSEVEISNSHMKNMLDAMEHINTSSSEIAHIIKVIDDIAFQTNILALNAAVEAARAGEAGRGFAVVAEEVRNLAARSAEAARSTTELIANSIESVEDGIDIANLTAESLGRVVGGVEQVNALIDEISTASHEQADAITQITGGIDQISSVVQNNSATSEQSAASSEELSSQAELLKEMMNRFKLD